MKKILAILVVLIPFILPGTAIGGDPNPEMFGPHIIWFLGIGIGCSLLGFRILVGILEFLDKLLHPRE
jgi:hypothetical protein